MPNDVPKKTRIKSYIPSLDKPYVDYDFTDKKDRFNDVYLYDFIISKFAREFGTNKDSAVKIINSMCLLEVLINRYWDEFYEKIKER